MLFYSYLGENVGDPVGNKLWISNNKFCELGTNHHKQLNLSATFTINFQLCKYGHKSKSWIQQSRKLTVETVFIYQPIIKNKNKTIQFTLN